MNQQYKIADITLADFGRKEIAYDGLIRQISDVYEQGQRQAILAVNSHLIDTYWKVGQYIVEFEQKGETRAIYGKGLLEKLSKDLSLLHGKGFSLSNLKRMRQFYLVYPIGAKASHQLSGSISAEAPHQLSWMHSFFFCIKPYHVAR